MTDDRLNTIKGRLNDYADELEDDDSILMMQSVYVRDVAYLIAEIEKYRTVVGLLKEGMAGWWIHWEDVRRLGIDIAAMKERK